MKGGSQPHLIEADDGHFYVVKPKDNPQHRRILINEWVSAVFLRFLQIATPEVAVVSLDAEFLAAHPEVGVQRGHKMEPVSSGCHFGSRLPGDPTRIALFDTLPNVLFPRVANLQDLAGLLVFDRWVANADYRQTIFFRGQVAEPGSVRPGFVMWAIDQGFTFQGPNWNLKTGGRQGLHHGNPLYESLSDWKQLEPWLTRIEYFPEEVADQALATLPREWLSGEDEAALEAMLEQLFRARSRIRHAVEDLLKAEAALFPNWPR
jgi:hypothetical protein